MLNLWRNDFGKSFLTLIVVYMNSINIELQVFHRSEKHTNTTPTQVNRPKIIWKENCLPEDDLRKLIDEAFLQRWDKLFINICSTFSWPNWWWDGNDLIFKKKSEFWLSFYFNLNIIRESY